MRIGASGPIQVSPEATECPNARMPWQSVAQTQETLFTCTAVQTLEIQKDRVQILGPPLASLMNENKWLFTYLSHLFICKAGKI